MSVLKIPNLKHLYSPRPTLLSTPWSVTQLRPKFCGSDVRPGNVIERKGSNKEGCPTEGSGFQANRKEVGYSPRNHDSGRKESVEIIGTASGMIPVEQYSGAGEDQEVVRPAYSNEIVVSEDTNLSIQQPKLNISGQSGLLEAEGGPSRQGKFSARYLTLEPSLAMDWLEISWDELHIKERIGAGSFGTVHRAEWHGSDVAVKVLSIQDFSDDQLKEFLRER